RDEQAAPRHLPATRQRLLHPPAATRVQLRSHLRTLHLLPDQHRVPAAAAAPPPRRQRQTTTPPTRTPTPVRRPPRPSPSTGRVVTTQPLRLTEPGEQPAPRLDDQSAAIV